MFLKFSRGVHHRAHRRFEFVFISIFHFERVYKNHLGPCFHGERAVLDFKVQFQKFLIEFDAGVDRDIAYEDDEFDQVVAGAAAGFDNDCYLWNFAFRIGH